MTASEESRSERFSLRLLCRLHNLVTLAVFSFPGLSKIEKKTNNSKGAVTRAEKVMHALDFRLERPQSVVQSNGARRQTLGVCHLNRVFQTA
eukprot:657308-Amphidinium_carterae.1